MSTLIPDIKTNNWQISLSGVGIVAEGLADIRQCIGILLSTRKGSDPLRPEFGSDIFQFTDSPINIAIPNVTRAIIESIEIWEKRVSIKSVTHQLIDTSNVQFNVTYQLVDSEIIDLLVFFMNGGYVNYESVSRSNLLIYGLIPSRSGTQRYTIELFINGSIVTPVIPPSGFETIAELFTWVQANWGGYGTWQLGSDRISLQANSGIDSGSLTLRVTNTLRFATLIPSAVIGHNFLLSFIPDPAPGTFPTLPFASMAEMLLWLQTNYSNYGTWVIEGVPFGSADFDMSDFDSVDFDIGLVSQYFLVLYTDVITGCFLEIEIE